MDVCAYLHEWTPRSAEAIAELSSIGVASVSLSWDVLAAHVSRTALQAKAIISAVDAADMSLGWIELPSWTCLDSASFERQTDDTYMRMQVAQRCGARGVIVSSGHRGSIGFEMSIAALTRLAVLAERLDVLLSVRNACGSAIEQLDALHVLFREVDSPALRLCLDNVAFQRSAVNPADAALGFANRTAPVRLGDEREARACALGEGTCYVEPTVRMLMSEGFEGELVVDAAFAAPAMMCLQQIGALASD